MSIMHNQPNPKHPGANPPSFVKGNSTLIDTDIPTPPEPNYERIIAHAIEVKFIDNRYVIPITIEFGSSNSENTVNISVKHRKLFAVFKLLDPSATINIGDKIINHPDEFPMGI